MRKIFLFASLLLVFNLSLEAQDLYDVNSIQEIKITFAESNWDELLDELYVEGKNNRLLANIEINGTVIDSVGIRYKGFSSVSTDREKNPFNIKLDETNNEDYQGYKKLKLGNLFQDPSFIREILSYEIARNYMPAPKANFARVYINDAYWGLYANVESIEEDFLETHFGDSNNAFFKCNPDELDLDGENSNLALSHGTDPENYKPYYDRVNGGWWELYLLMKKLNDNPEDIEEILNVDRALWMHALNYVMVNFDSYIGYAQNYYLYRKSNGQFQTILWDLNQSFGSYRNTDASDFFSGFNIEEAKTIDPLAHYNSVSVQARPLMRSLFENDRYRKMYLAHIRSILKENFDNGEYASRAASLQQLIDEAVQEDDKKFYSYDHFINNLNSTVSDLVDYPGITELMDARSDYFANYPNLNDEPIISNTDLTRTNETTGEHEFEISTSNANSAFLFYRTSRDLPFEQIEMNAEGNGNYSVDLNFGNNLEYYFYAENEVAGAFWPSRAAHKFFAINYDNIKVGDLVINEFLASNDASNADENGDYDDWVEIFNNAPYDISLKGLYLSDDPENLEKWEFPDVSIPAGGYKLIWADEDGSDGALHANFKLSGGGESVLISDRSGNILDEIEYGEQEADVSFGRLPNGSGPFTALSPTPKANNDPTSISQVNTSLAFKAYPNPALNQLNIELQETGDYTIELINLSGITLKHVELKTQNYFQINLDGIQEGFYILNIISDSSIVSQKILINEKI